MNTRPSPVRPDAILIHLRQMGLLKSSWVVTFVVLLVIYAAIGQWVVQNYGIALPGFSVQQPVVSTPAETSDASVASRPAAEGGESLHSLETPVSRASDRKPQPDPKGFSPSVLKPIGRDVYQSAAGLIYRPGSEDGHRIDHVMHHGEDDLDKPVHGVFDGDKDQILAVIDEAWQIAQKNGPPQVRIEEQGDRTIYTVMMNRKIGFKGGQAGQRQRNPALKRIKLILEGHDVITAYPSE